jgi:hypothetical protein
MANNSVDVDLVPELGDEIKIIGKTGKIYGIIVYRSESMIRVRPFSSKTEVYEFPLTETGEYVPELGVTETQLDPEKKAQDPHFSKQMEVSPLSVLEFYDREGRSTRKTVRNVIATDNDDGLEFDDGTTMNFQFIGLPEPYITFLDITNLEEEGEIANIVSETSVAPEADEEHIAIVDDTDFIAKLLEQQGDILQDETALINRPYSEDSQRQDMFISVMQLIAPKTEQQKNPRILRKAYILTDLLAALKRSIVQLSEQGQPLLNTSKSYTTSRVDDILEHTLPSTILPIVHVRKTLYTGMESWGAATVEFVAEPTALIEVEEARKAYSKSISIPRRTTNAFETYIQSITDSFKVFDIQPGSDYVWPKYQTDVEVIRGEPDSPVGGYSELRPDITPTSDDATDIAPSLVRIQNRGTTFHDPVANKTIVLQNADTAKRVGHIVLSPDLAYSRNGTSSSVLLWDMHASEWCRNRRTSFLVRMNETDTSQVFLGESIPMKVRDLLRSRLQPSLSLMSWANAVIMDSIGLRALELTKEQMKEFHKKLVEGQTTWALAMANMKQKALEYMSKESTYAVKPILTLKDSLLFSDAIKADAAFAKFMEVYTNKETSLVNYDLALSSALLDVSQGTLLAYWSALVSQVSQEHIDSMRQTYIQETERQIRKIETERERKRRFVAAPIVNKCSHVRDYEIINAIKNDSERMKSLEGFVRKYNGGMQNNFVKCNKCLQNLVCKHELLLLQEFKIQDQATTIHKQLVLEFGGPVFMGSYICKNCGQKISNLEFDTHLEFDDEGRPLVGRTVIETEAESEDDEDASKAKYDVRVAYITNSSKDLQRDFTLYQSLKRMFEEAHIVLSDETAKVLLEELKIYLSTLMAKEVYEPIRIKAKGVLPSYDTFKNQQTIGAIGALAIIELQCLPNDIPIPNRLCPYSRTGYPIDYMDGIPEGTTINMGAIEYIECVISQISSAQEPWDSVLWANKDMKEEKRKALIHEAVLSSLAAMRGVDKTLTAAAKKPITKLIYSHNERLRAALQAQRQTPVVTKNENGDRIIVAKLSDLDRLPSQFHPCPVYERTDATDVIPLGNAAQFSNNIESKPVPEIKPIVQTRIQQLQHDIMYQMNKDMNTSAANRTYTMEDVGRIGLGYIASKQSDAEKAEYETIRQAYAFVDRRDPARPNTGTHMYVPWVAPELEVAEATPDESIYYKLFSKVCAKGDTIGSAHEFTYGNKCRYCQFQLHDALIYETMSEIPASAKDINDRLAAQAQVRKAAVEDACREIGVEINEHTFFELRAAINIKKQTLTAQRTEGSTILDRIVGLGAFLQAPAAQDDLRILVSSMQRILDPKGDGTVPPLQGNARYEPMRLFYERVDMRRAAFIKLLTDNSSRGSRNAVQHSEFIESHIQQLDTILSFIRGGECLRTSKRMFILNSRFIRSSQESIVHMRRWVPSIYKPQAEELDKRIKYLQNVSELFLKQLDIIKDPENPEGLDFLITQMNQMTEHIGKTLQYWEQNIRPNQVFAVQNQINEYSDVLRWCLYSIFLTMFGSATNPDLHAAKQVMADWILVTIAHEQKTFEVYRKTPDEIRLAMNDRRESEKALKIAQQDKEEDREVRRLMRTALKLGYGEETILRSKGYKVDAEKVRFQELQALGIVENPNNRGEVPQGDTGMGDIRDEDGDA